MRDEQKSALGWDRTLTWQTRIGRLHDASGPRAKLELVPASLAVSCQLAKVSEQEVAVDVLLSLDRGLQKAIKMARP